jgi:hypothetical protein
VKRGYAGVYFFDGTILQRTFFWKRDTTIIGNLNKKVYHVPLYIMEIGTSTKIPWKRDTTLYRNPNKKVYHVPLYIMEIGAFGNVIQLL